MFYASISASFAVEQFGLPKITGRTAEGDEMWNEDVAKRRLKVLIESARH